MLLFATLYKEKIMIQPISLTNKFNSLQFKGKEDIRIIPSSKPTDLEKSIENELGINPTETVTKKFANGETYVNIKDDMRNKDVYIMPNSGNEVNDNLMEVYLKADAAKRMGANKIVAVLPNFPYARQERKSEPGEPISAALNLSLLHTSGVDEVITADIHAPATEGFGKDIKLTNLDSLDEMTKYFQDKFDDTSDLVVISPDFGGKKRADKLAKALNCNKAIIYKERAEHNKAKAEMLLGNDVNGKTCIIYDDMIDTAGTMKEAVEMLTDKGAKEVYIAACHGLFNGKALENLSNPAIKEIVVTNSQTKPEVDKIIQVDIASKIAGKMLDISA